MLHPIEITADMIPAEIREIKGMVPFLIRELAEEARNEILRLAMAKLNTTFDDYAAGVQPVVYSINGHDQVATIVLVGKVPGMIENGWAGGDMKPFLLAGRNAKVGADGSRYNVVPFRHMTPGTSGRHAPAMGSQFTKSLGPKKAEQLGKVVHGHAKKLRGGRRLQSGLAPILKPHHRTDIYSGMIKERFKHASGKKSTQYKTYRMVSDNSDPAAWIHPGIEPHHFFKDASDYINRVAPAVFQHAVSSFKRGV